MIAALSLIADAIDEWITLDVGGWNRAANWRRILRESVERTFYSWGVKMKDDGYGRPGIVAGFADA